MNNKNVPISELIKQLESAKKKEALESLGIHCDSKEMEDSISKSLRVRMQSFEKKHGDISWKEIMP